METGTAISSFKGFPVLEIWQVKTTDGEDPQTVGKMPVVSFGVKKAKAILDEIEAIREFVEQAEEEERQKREKIQPKKILLRKKT